MQKHFQEYVHAELKKKETHDGVPCFYFCIL